MEEDNVNNRRKFTLHTTVQLGTNHRNTRSKAVQHRSTTEKERVENFSLVGRCHIYKLVFQGPPDGDEVRAARAETLCELVGVGVPIRPPARLPKPMGRRNGGGRDGEMAGGSKD
eukprot:CAMPEP_0194752920 /NCGR_PEP_ID=MMETSP0323_2-20130528/6828_1 /TAXON_ID=2866 ORGANISM="Crypthecodinium cohnii, Strain Seligo" /NCGR_SAMPLE_ID=MMETSP0323_2 /ASSEMBLY_ACC=CAM_ASM_000346 /LENGTH=114 /DNA_ID=CAMNT_0039670327 /DNA_START=23 /DNA_END=367 /DNA_ORIENTATION=-